YRDSSRVQLRGQFGEVERLKEVQNVHTNIWEKVNDWNWTLDINTLVANTAVNGVNIPFIYDITASQPLAATTDFLNFFDINALQ
ncbi:hypothetical protein HHI36_012216, partial [Cryptolaemus montrouzieri]